MQYYNDTEAQTVEHKSLFNNTNKTRKTRKWREIEDLKARQKLLKELRDIDNSFNFSLNELI